MSKQLEATVILRRDLLEIERDAKLSHSGIRLLTSSRLSWEKKRLQGDVSDGYTVVTNRGDPPE